MIMTEVGVFLVSIHLYTQHADDVSALRVIIVAIIYGYNLVSLLFK